MTQSSIPMFVRQNMENKSAKSEAEDLKGYLKEIGMTEEEYEKLSEEEQDEVLVAMNKAFKNALKTAIEAKADVETISKLQKRYDEADKSVKEVRAILHKQGEQIQEFIRAMKEGNADGTSSKKAFELEIKANKEAIQAIAKGQAGELVVKAPTLRASVDSSTAAVRLEDIGQLGVKRRALYDVLPKITVADGNNQGVIRYIDWDEDTIVRAAKVIAEGAAFDPSTAKWKEYVLPLRKIGDTIIVSEEFLEDEVALSQELVMFIDTNVNTVVDSQLITGDNTGQNLKGMMTSVPAYVPTAAGILAPNLYDLSRKVRTAITFERGSKYDPDMVLANANVIDQLLLTKDANENYIFKDMVRMGTLTIVEDNHMADNTMIVGDSRFAKIYEKAGVVLSEGYINDQFNKDLKTLKLRKRLALLIREADKTGFRKVTDIEAALDILAASPASS